MSEKKFDEQFSILAADLSAEDSIYTTLGAFSQSLSDVQMSVERTMCTPHPKVGDGSYRITHAQHAIALARHIIDPDDDKTYTLRAVDPIVRVLCGMQNESFKDCAQKFPSFKPLNTVLTSADNPLLNGEFKFRDVAYTSETVLAPIRAVVDLNLEKNTHRLRDSITAYHAEKRTSRFKSAAKSIGSMLAGNTISLAPTTFSRIRRRRLY